MSDRLPLRLRSLVRLHPLGFRDRWAGEMEGAFRELLADANTQGSRIVWRVTLRELVDLTRTAVRLRLGMGTTTGGGVTMKGWNLEVAQTARALVRRPGFTAVVVGTLGLGLGLATAMFALVNGVLLEPLGYREPDRVVGVFLTIPSLGWEQGPVSYPDFDDARTRSRPVFEHLSAYQTGARRVLVQDGEEPRILRGSVASGDLFETSAGHHSGVAIAPWNARSARWRSRRSEGGARFVGPFGRVSAHHHAPVSRGSPVPRTPASPGGVACSVATCSREVQCGT